VTFTVYLNVAVPPAAMSMRVLSTALLMPQVKVRVKAGEAVVVDGAVLLSALMRKG